MSRSLLNTLRRCAGLLAFLVAPVACDSGDSGDRVVEVPARIDWQSLRAEVEQLASRHLVSEAVVQTEAVASSNDESSWSAAESGLRERQVEFYLVLSRADDALALARRVVRAPGEDEMSSHRRRALLARALVAAAEFEEASLLFANLPAELRRKYRLEEIRALRSSRRFDEALVLLLAALIEDPWKDPSYLELGRLLAQSRDAQAAKPWLDLYRESEAFHELEQEALSEERRGDVGRAYWKHAALARARGRLYEAMRLNREAIKTSPGLVEAWLDLARLSLFLEHPSDAIEVLGRLPAQGSVLEVLGDAHAAKGNAAEALSLWRRRLDEEPEREATRARLLELEKPAPLGPLEQARAEVRRVIDPLPISRSVEGLLSLVSVYRQHGERGAARELCLYSARLAPRRADVQHAFSIVFSEDTDRFLRIWFLRRSGGESWRQRVVEELRVFGVDPQAVLAASA